MNRDRNGLERAVVILGAGPAGAALALGLQALGHAVTVIREARRFRAVEGVSARVIAAIKQAGFERALSAVKAPTPRRACWNGQVTEANSEYLIDRAQFDALLREDLLSRGVEVIDGRVLRCARQGAVHVIDFVETDRPDEAQTLRASFLAEARGRSASHAGVSRVRGAETVSLLQLWQGPARSRGSAVESFEDGWAWMAAMEDGTRYLQLTLDVATAGLPPKAELGAFCAARLQRIAAARPFMAEARPLAAPHARTSTPLLLDAVCGADWIRVGDAAMAVDPLSGNGIFQALSSALQAPAVVNTLLKRPEHRALAQAFHSQRVSALFHRFARIGRDFYAQETRWPERPFWQARAAWPDAEALHVDVTPDKVAIARRPVLLNGFVTEAEVVVTPDQPLGVWHVEGLEMAPLLAALRADNGLAPEQVLRDRLGARAAQAPALLDWMRAQGWLA